MRAFLGLDVPESARRVLSGIRVKFKQTSVACPGLRWMNSENFHLTVRFLGDIEESEGDMLTSRLRGSLRAFGPVLLQVEGISWFPARHPTVLAAGLAPSQRLQKLFDIVESEVVSAGFPAESRSSHPHITVARLRQRETNSLPKIDEQVNAEFWCRELILFQSRLLPTGSQYAHFGEISLGGLPMIDRS
ncbi:MAG TPA: RNA 2',3'-cyclic phosphodiesterase [Rhodothermia bacterium]